MSARTMERKKQLKVTFDSDIFLDELFNEAFKYSKIQSRFKLTPNDHSKISIGIDIVTYGSYNAKMAYIITNDPIVSCHNSHKPATGHHRLIEKIQIFEDHIGNLKYDASYTHDDFKFIDQFKTLLNKCFDCLGKRWYELNDADLDVSRSYSFKLVKRDHFPCVFFDEQRCYPINKILSKFFQTMLKSLNVNLNAPSNSLKSVCVTIPSDFHTYQRLTLKNCLENINIKNFLLVNKSTSLTLPFLTQRLDDSSQKFIIDFGSGYMNCSIVQLMNEANLVVKDQLADKSISSKHFFESCYREMKRLASENSISINRLKARNELYRVMNEQTNSQTNTIKETWSVKSSHLTTSQTANAFNSDLSLNMKRIGVELFVSSVIEKLKKTSLIDARTSRIVSEIDDILICSDAIIYEYLEPLLKYYCDGSVRITFVDNDCASLGAAYLASDLLRIKTFDMVPYPIGVGLYNGIVKNIIKSKINFPCMGKHIFQTIVDYQHAIKVNLYEVGQSSLARNCKHISEFVIEDIPEAPVCEMKIEIKVTLDQNGILDATAVDYHSKRKLDIHADEKSNLSFNYSGRYVNIDEKLDRESRVADLYIVRCLDDFDYYFDYILNLYKYSPADLRYFIATKILCAKKFLSKNRFNTNVQDFVQDVQLKHELDQIILKHQPALVNPNQQSNSEIFYLNELKSKNGLCTIL